MSHRCQGSRESRLQSYTRQLHYYRRKRMLSVCATMPLTSFHLLMLSAKHPAVPRHCERRQNSTLETLNLLMVSLPQLCLSCLKGSCAQTSWTTGWIYITPTACPLPHPTPFRNPTTGAGMQVILHVLEFGHSAH